MRRTAGVVATALTLVLTACGSGGGSNGATSTPSRTTSTTSDTTTSDRRLARAAVIRPADLPGSEPTARTRSGGTEIEELARGIPQCATLAEGLRDGRVRVRSPRLTRLGTTIDADVDVYATEADAQAQLELYRDPGVIGCFEHLSTKAMRSTAPAGSTVQSVSVSPIAVEDVGDGGYGFRLTATIVHNGVPRTVLSDVVGVAIGRIGVSLTVTGDDTAALARTETAVLPLVAHRVGDAGG
jgi:hypothetical protein